MAQVEKKPPVLGLRSPRYVRGYPKKKHTQIRRLKVGAVKREFLRQIRPRRHARSPGTTYDVEATQEQRAQQGIKGSLLERIFYKALVDRGYIPDVDFDFQASEFGGRAEYGGLVADFVFFVPMVIVQVQSYWHSISREIEARDETQQALLEALGYTVLNIWPETLLDSASLDWWMDRNISFLWGTSYTRYEGVSTARPLIPASTTYVPPQQPDIGFPRQTPTPPQPQETKGGGLSVSEYTDLLNRISTLTQRIDQNNYDQRISYMEAAMTGMQAGTDVRVTSGMLAIQLQSSDYVQAVSGWKITKDGSAEFQNITARGTIYASAGIIEGVLTIGLGGGIFQGTGTFASPETALKIYRDTSSGVGLIEMWGSSTKQVYFGTDGKLYAGGGNVWLSSVGIRLLESDTDYSSIQWQTSGAAGVASIGAYKVAYAGPTYQNLMTIKTADVAASPYSGGGSAIYVAACNSEWSITSALQPIIAGSAIAYPRINIYTKDDNLTASTLYHIARLSHSVGQHFFTGVSIGYTAATQPSIAATDFWVANDVRIVGGLAIGGSATDPGAGELWFGADTYLVRGAADRLDLATGDSLNIVSGAIQIAGTSAIDSSRNFSAASSLTLGGDAVISRGAANRLDLASGDDLNIVSGSILIAGDSFVNNVRSVKASAVQIGDDVNLNRTSANVLDLATGDSLNVVSGAIQIGGTTAIDSSRNADLATSVTLGADVVLSRSSANTLALASGDNFNIVSGSLAIAGNSAIDSSRNADLASSLTLGGDVVISRGAANRLDLASGDSLNLISGSVAVAGNVFTSAGGDLWSALPGGVMMTNITLADDAAINYQPSETVGFAILIQRTNAEYWCMFTWRVDGSPFVRLNVTGSANIVTGTSALTTGTSNGTDTKFNIAAVNDGKIYLKNRLGSEGYWSLILFPATWSG